MSALPALACPVCDKMFTPHTRKQKFCSDQCAHKGARLRHSGGPWIRTCKACGRVFKTTKKQQVFCSVECQQKEHKRQILAKYHARRAQERPATAVPLDVVNPMLTAKTRQEEARIFAAYEADMKIAMWFAYLPDAERAANIKTLTKTQRKMAERVWRERHAGAHGVRESDCGWRA